MGNWLRVFKFTKTGELAMDINASTYNPEMANKAFIRYARFMDIHTKIQRCQKISKISLEPQCLSLEGEAGAGKSTLGKDYASAFPRYFTPEGTVIPVFYAEIPSPTTVKATASALLSQLGDPGEGAGEVWTLNRRLVNLIKDCKVELVILDEFSNLIDRKTDHVLFTVSEWLKMLIKQTGVPYMVMGIKGKVERVLDTNQQLSRLFAYRETLEPFDWDIKNENSLDDYFRFVSTAEKAVGLPIAPNVPKTELYYRIHYATNGLVGNIMNLLRYASLYANEKNKSTVELVDLDFTFEQHLRKRLKAKENPFELGADKSFSPPPTKPVSDDSNPKKNGRNPKDKPDVFLSAK